MKLLEAPFAVRGRAYATCADVIDASGEVVATVLYQADADSNDMVAALVADALNASAQTGSDVDARLIGDAMASILVRTPELDLRNHDVCTDRLRLAGFSYTSISRHLCRAIVRCRQMRRERAGV